MPSGNFQNLHSIIILGQIGKRLAIDLGLGHCYFISMQLLSKVDFQIDFLPKWCIQPKRHRANWMKWQHFGVEEGWSTLQRGVGVEASTLQHKANWMKWQYFGVCIMERKSKWIRILPVKQSHIDPVQLANGSRHDWWYRLHHLRPYFERNMHDLFHPIAANVSEHIWRKNGIYTTCVVAKAPSIRPCDLLLTPN